MRNAIAHHVGMTFSVWAGAVHLVWAILMWFGWAKPLVEWLAAMHGVSSAMSVGTLAVDRGIELIVLALVCGYVAGYVIGLIWERTK